MRNIKIINGIILVLIVINLILMITKKISAIVFWGVLIIAAIYVYKIVPKLNR